MREAKDAKVQLSIFMLIQKVSEKINIMLKKRNVSMTITFTIFLSELQHILLTLNFNRIMGSFQH